jgi:hypothetical protein
MTNVITQLLRSKFLRSPKPAWPFKIQSTKESLRLMLSFCECFQFMSVPNAIHEAAPTVYGFGNFYKLNI